MNSIFANVEITNYTKYTATCTYICCKARVKYIESK